MLPQKEKVETWLKTGTLVDSTPGPSNTDCCDSGYSTLSYQSPAPTDSIHSKTTEICYSSSLKSLSTVLVRETATVDETINSLQLMTLDASVPQLPNVSQTQRSQSSLQLNYPYYPPLSSTNDSLCAKSNLAELNLSSVSVQQIPSVPLRVYDIQNVASIKDQYTYPEPSVHWLNQKIVPFDYLGRNIRFVAEFFKINPTPGHTNIKPISTPNFFPTALVPVGNTALPSDIEQLKMWNPEKYLSWKRSPDVQEEFRTAFCNPQRTFLAPFQTRSLTAVQSNQQPSISRSTIKRLRNLKASQPRNRGRFQRRRRSSSRESFSSSPPSPPPGRNRNLEDDPYHIPVQGIRRSENVCCVCHNPSGRTRVPLSARLNLWINTKIFIPESNRTCASHVSSGHFVIDACNHLTFLAQELLISDKEAMALLNHVSDYAQSLEKNQPKQPFNDDVSCSIETGFDLDQFNKTLITVEDSLRNTNVRNARTALGIFLVKLRHDMSYQLIGHLYNLGDIKAVARTFDSVMNALLLRFVPRHLGFGHISREDFAKKHKSTLANSILGSNEHFAMVIVDGTYLPCEKSRNFAAARLLWSQHKGYRLLKMMVYCAPNGYMLAVDGPFYANGKNNDESIFEATTAPTDSPFRKFFKYGDMVIWDRGFRDVIPLAEEMGLEVKMPHFLKKGQKQHSTQDANESRLITMVRWPIEVVNGRIKNKFKFFNGRIRNTFVPKAANLFKIGCALINAYLPPIRSDTLYDAYLAQKVMNRMTQGNTLLTYLAEYNLITRRIPWETPFDARKLKDFPTLSLDDLFEITMGVYQIRQAPSYTAEHVKEDGKYEISYYKESPNLLLVKLFQSRHSNSTTYKLFIKYDPNDEGSDSIKGWYCTCPSGARNLGTCAHVSSVLWYLGYACHLNKIKFPAEHLFDTVMDAGRMIEENRNDIDESENEDDEIHRSEDEESL